MPLRSRWLRSADATVTCRQPYTHARARVLLGINVNTSPGYRFDTIGFIKKPQLMLNMINLTDEKSPHPDAAATLF